MTQELISINPATFEEVGWTPITDPAAIPPLIERMRRALVDWREAGIEERIAIVKRAAGRIRAERDALADLVTREMGKLLGESRGEVENAAHRLEYFTATAPAALTPHEERLAGFRSITRREPIGVVASIAPWNFPVGIPLWSIAPALLAGNAVLFKPSERTPLVGEKLFQIFREAGVPEGVMEIAHGAEEVGRAIVASDVEMIAFVGSQAVGRFIMERSARTFRRLALELGGKDPMIVCADSNLEQALAGAIAGVFRNCGQACCSVERVLIARELFERFCAAAVERTRRLRVGDGRDPATEVGPLSHIEELERMERHVADAAAKGATVLCGGKRTGTKGHYFQPTVITGVTDDMLVCREEIFGPIMVLDPFGDIDEAIARANASPFGLTASVWSKDADRAERIAQRLQAGTIAINQVVSSVVECPWGGVKQSGVGRMLGPEAVREFTETVNYRYPR